MQLPITSKEIGHSRMKKNNTILAAAIIVLCIGIQMLPCSSAPGFNRHTTSKMDALIQQLLDLGSQYDAYNTLQSAQLQTQDQSMQSSFDIGIVLCHCSLI